MRGEMRDEREGGCRRKLQASRSAATEQSKPATMDNARDVRNLILNDVLEYYIGVSESEQRLLTADLLTC